MCLNCKNCEIKTEQMAVCRLGKGKPKTVVNEKGLTKNYRHCEGWTKEQISNLEKELIELVNKISQVKYKN